MKKILFTIIILIILAVLVWVGFLLFNRSTKAPTPSSVNFPLASDIDFPQGGGSFLDSQNDYEENTAGRETAGGFSFRKITNRPVAGMVAFERDKETILRYIEKETGHIFEYTTETSQTRRLSNNTIPRIIDAFWGKSGENIVIKYLNEESARPKFFSATLSETSTTTNESEPTMALTGTFLPENVYDLCLLPNKKIFSLAEENTGFGGYLSGLSYEDKVQKFESQLKEWQVSCPNESSVLLTTKPSGGVLGYAYLLNTKNKTSSLAFLGKLAGGVRGLSAQMSPEGSLVLYSGLLDNGGVGMFISDTPNNDSFVFPIKTFSEKCVWAKGGANVYCAEPRELPRFNYPDDWYKGKVSFSDAIWEMDIKIGDGYSLFVPWVDAGEEIDAIKLTLSENERYLFFINKKDYSLWELKLTLD